MTLTLPFLIEDVWTAQVVARSYRKRRSVLTHQMALGFLVDVPVKREGRPPKNEAEAKRRTRAHKRREERRSFEHLAELLGYSIWDLVAE